MNKLIPESINSFRSGLEISSSEPAALKRTIVELMARISEQEDLIALKSRYIEELEDRNERWTPTSTPTAIDKSSKKLASELHILESKFEGFQDNFSDFYSAERERVKNALSMLSKLPSTPELKELTARLRIRSKEIHSAKLRGQITPFHALEELRQMCDCAFTYLDQNPRPAEPLQKEVFRARLLIEGLERCDTSINTPEACKILSTVEGQRICPKQSLRAMRRAAALNPEVKFELGKKRKARIYKSRRQ